MLTPQDVISIHQLLARYGHLLDRRDWDGFAALWAEDAEIDYRGATGSVVRRGRAVIVEWFRSVHHPPAHHMTNVVVDDHVDDHGRVAVWSKFFAPFSRPDDRPHRLYGGDYEDVLVQCDRRWVFASRRCIPRWNLTVVADDSAPAYRRSF